MFYGVSFYFCVSLKSGRGRWIYAAEHRFYFTGKRKSNIIEIVFLYLSVGDRAQNTPAIWCLSPEKLQKKKLVKSAHGCQRQMLFAASIITIVLYSEMKYSQQITT